MRSDDALVVDEKLKDRMEKNETIALDKARELVCNAALWPRVRDFLWDFAPQIHESWLAGVFKGIDDNRLQSTAIDSPRVKRYILDSLGVKPFFHSFPKDDGSRLALLDGATLLEIARWLGALVCADLLRRVTSGAEVRALKAALPGVYPEVFGYTAYFGSLEVWKFGGLEVETVDGEKNIAETVISTGSAILFSAVSSLPAPLASRLRLKLPNLETPKPLNSQTSKPLSKPLNLQPSILKLLKLKFPKDYALCCS